MKYFSLFSGIGGFELGIQTAFAGRHSPCTQGDEYPLQSESNICGWDGSAKTVQPTPFIESLEKCQSSMVRPRNKPNGNYRQTPICVGFSEVDKYASQIYKTHFPNHKEYGDVSKIAWADVEDFELLCGGFPCQAFSIAGKREGFSDTRGTLFFEIARVAQEKQPRLLLLENVKGLLSHDKGKTFGTILNTLDELGYDLQWQVLNSKNFGVPQNRERVFIVGHLRGECRPEVFPIREGNRENKTSYEETRAKIIDPKYLMRDCRIYDEQCPTMAKRDYKEPFVVAKKGERNGKLDDRTLESKKGFQENGKMRDMQEREKDGVSPQERRLARPQQGEHTGIVSGMSHKTASDGRQKESISQEKEKSSWTIRRLTCVECERLQGFPDGWTEGISDTQRYKCLGNAVTVNVITAIAEKLS